MGRIRAAAADDLTGWETQVRKGGLGLAVLAILWPDRLYGLEILKGLPDADVRETLAELRAHVLDKVDGDLTPARVEAAIAELGSPRDIARVNITERIVARAEARPSPLGVVGAVVRLASLSLFGA